MLINSNDIKTTKKHIEVMQAFIDGKEIEYERINRTNVSEIWKTASTPMWNFTNYKYRIKQSKPEYVYPIYKRLKEAPETVVKFTSLDSGIYVSTHKNSIYRQGHPALNMAPHTDSAWEDCTASIDAEKAILVKSNTEELFEVMVYCDIMKEFMIKQVIYSNEEIEFYNAIKTGRSFIIDKDTKQIIKVNYN